MSWTVRSGRDIFPTAPTPPDPGPPLQLGKATTGQCACGQPTRDTAFGCDDCAGELTRFLSEVTYLTEQLEATIIREKAKHPGSSTSGGEALPWNDHASLASRRLTGLLAQTVRYCLATRVRHQSPDDTNPLTDTQLDPSVLARWLLWRVDGLMTNERFPAILRAAMKTERAVLRAIDCGPDLIYLGVCTKNDCGGAVYAVVGQPTGKCRACRATWETEGSRANLYAELDGMLCSAAEIARLSTYLGIPADREQVRKLVNQWHKRGRLVARGHDDTAPTFLYSEVVGLLSSTYEQKPA